MIVGLAAAHRAVAQGKLGAVWLWVTYALLVLVAPFAVVGAGGVGFRGQLAALAAAGASAAT